MTCTLDALALSDVEPLFITVGDLCTICHGTGDARLKVTVFLPVGRTVHLAAEYRACPTCEGILIDAAHTSAAASPRHLVHTLRLHGHRDFNRGLAQAVVCDTTGAAA